MVTRLNKPESTGSLWEEAPTEFDLRHVCMEIYGPTDTGRSTLALTAPGPIAYFHAHEKIAGLFEKFTRTGKMIRHHKFGGVFRGSPDDIQAQAMVSVDRFEKALTDAYSWARSIVIDTHTELWEIYQLARLGTMVRNDRNEKDNKMGQLVYTEINNRWLSMLKEFRVQQPTSNKPFLTNLIIIGQTKDEYKKNKITGKTESTGLAVSAGQKKVPFFCDVRVRTDYKKRENEFTATIEKPWWNNDVRNMELENSSFSQIMSLITETDESEWE